MEAQHAENTLLHLILDGGRDLSDWLQTTDPWVWGLFASGYPGATAKCGPTRDELSSSAAQKWKASPSYQPNSYFNAKAFMAADSLYEANLNPDKEPFG